MQTITKHFINGDFVESQGTAVWTANTMAVLWPESCKAIVPVSGYLIGNPAANKMPLPPKAECA